MKAILTGPRCISWLSLFYLELTAANSPGVPRNPRTNKFSESEADGIHYLQQSSLIWSNLTLNTPKYQHYGVNQ